MGMHFQHLPNLFCGNFADGDSKPAAAGAEAGRGASSAAAGGDLLRAGAECVICLSEPRDTTVLPCRHMCMCGDCAQQLSVTTKKCPVCRCRECVQ